MGCLKRKKEPHSSEEKTVTVTFIVENNNFISVLSVRWSVLEAHARITEGPVTWDTDSI